MNTTNEPKEPKCYRCKDEGYITHFGEGADAGHDIDIRCPVCNPKRKDYDDYEFDEYPRGWGSLRYE